MNFLVRSDYGSYNRVYYEDCLDVVTVDACCGVEFGSVVEGSDATSGPFTHLFPFCTSDWDRDEDAMDEETTHLWEEANGSD